MEGLRRLDEMRKAQQEKSNINNGEETSDMAGETRREKLARILRDLIDSSGDISGVAVVSMDGLIMASDLPTTVEQARVGAVAAAILSLSGRSVKQLQRGDLHQTMIQGSDGYIMITSAGPNAVLVALTSQSINLGMVFLEVRECADAVAGLLS
jgi:predicted regulator of Ras-like GTPase activity (Roadblock/LC7/MglB family)